ncbi:unnamed protein product [Polarella glacialis]|uniref:Phosphatidylinositol-specific phospholipase C X domain-containing protein n=1 Tax=Polarella glacialis TaxID=89957 RepID=A0A813L3F3_POLGL|nr:unnamed protein product [Polarella glacialis]
MRCPRHDVVDVGTRGPCPGCVQMLQDVPMHAWMGSLPEEVRSLHSISELALPCCHNAGALAVKCIPRCTLAGFVGEALADVWIVEALASPIARRAAVCQALTVDLQLRAGVRVLDFRIGVHLEEFHICHGVVCDLFLRQALHQVGTFLAASQDEVVVVLIKADWEHRADFEPLEEDLSVCDVWRKLQDLIVEVLGDFLRDQADERDQLALSLRDLVATGQRALVLVQAPPEVELCRVLHMSSANLRSSWRDDTKTVGDMIVVLSEWQAAGLLSPKLGQLRLLEVALPGTPCALASAAQEAFCDFIGDGPLAVGVNLDFPSPETLRWIVGKNWEKR